VPETGERKGLLGFSILRISSFVINDAAHFGIA
jgi:hypothetical protein